MRKPRSISPTAFGKEMRKLRIDREETMKDTSRILGITQAYISHLENGKCQVPDGFEEKVISLYNLSGEHARRFRKAAIISKNRYVITAKTNIQKVLAYTLCQHIDDLDDEELEGIKDFIEESIKLKELTDIESGDSE